MNITGIPVGQWNQTADDIYSPFLRVGSEQSIGGGGNLPQGRIANRARESGWKHPFTVIPIWDTQFELSEAEQLATGRKRGAWLLTMTPGFVNGHAPAMSVRTKDIPEGAHVWGNKYGKETRKHARLADFTQVLLTDEWTPFMRVNSFMDTRSEVFGATPAIPINVPIFFRSLRAMAKPKESDFLGDFFSMATAGGGAFGDNPTAGENFVLGMLNGSAGPSFVQGAPKEDGFAEGDRYCYFCDVVLTIDRPATRQIFQFDEFGINRFAGFQIDPPDSGLYNARLGNVGVYLLPKEPTVEDIQSGAYQEPKFDEIAMARVFWLSPSKNMLDDNAPITPNGSWIPFVRHEVFWNLSYAALEIFDPFKPDRTLDWFKGISSVLAGGVAFLIIGSMADMLEAQFDEVSTLLNNTRVRTRFWTT